MAVGALVAILVAIGACASQEKEEELRTWAFGPTGKADSETQPAVLEDMRSGAPNVDASRARQAMHADVGADLGADLGTDLSPAQSLCDAASMGDQGPAEVPPPLLVPEFSEEPPLTCAAADASQWYFQFLDNLCDDKVQPGVHDRNRRCPVVDSAPGMALADGSWVTYEPSDGAPIWDTTSLPGFVPETMEISVILIKRVSGVPYYRYLSNGRHDVSFQPWSTTKVLAAANAGSTLRLLSSGEVGLDADVGGHRVGDLVTSLVNYDNAPYTSNGLGAYFHDIGGRQRADDLMGPLWLNRPNTETFGGNYGDAAPPINAQFTSPTGWPLTVTPDLSTGFANHLSTAALAEAVKRLVLHREEPEQRLPGLTWPDVQVLLYGAEDSTLKGGWGGMSADTAVYLQTGHDMDYIEARSLGQWSTFSKLGLGSQGQFAHVGYACFPVLDSAGEPVPGHGREFVIAAHLTEGGGSWSGRDRELARIYRRIELRIVDGRL